MTRIEFHFNVDDRLHHACRLLRKMVGQGLQGVVTGREADLRALDGLLWTFSVLDFLPHRWDDQPGDGSAITLSLDSSRPGLVGSVLVNLGEQVPSGFERWTRLVEVVSLEAEDRAAARLRWRHYSHQGHEILQHDLSKGAA